MLLSLVGFDCSSTHVSVPQQALGNLLVSSLVYVSEVLLLLLLLVVVLFLFISATAFFLEHPRTSLLILTVQKEDSLIIGEQLCL